LHDHLPTPYTRQYTYTLFFPHFTGLTKFGFDKSIEYLANKVKLRLRHISSPDTVRSLFAIFVASAVISFSFYTLALKIMSRIASEVKCV